MKNKSKILIAQILAGILTFSCVATSCVETNGGYVETGTTIKFDYNDGKSRPYSVVAGEGETVEKPETPIREGYEFSHWQTAKDGGEQVTFPYAPSENVTLYAAWTAKQYKVTFDMNYNNDNDIEKSIAYGQTVEAPAETEIPVRNGYEFFAWQNKSEGGSTITFPYTVKKDVTFYAIWASGGIYTLDFDLNYDGAGTLDPLKVMAGNEIEKKNTPTVKRDGYVFVGWSTSNKATTAEECITFPYEPTANETLYAVWQIQTYIVTYKQNVIDGPQNGFAQFTGLLYGDDIPQPEGQPTRPGHTFIGWYTTSQGGKPVDFTKKVEGTVNYYAHWQSTAVVTDTFHAEFTEFDPTEKFPGYSGAAEGAGVISNQGDFIEGLIHKESDYETNKIVSKSEGHFVTYMYKKGATITFKIYATEAVNNVTLQANLATEFVTDIVVEPTGEYAWKVVVNGTSINYDPIYFGDELNKETNASPFKMYTLATNISLKKGENIIQFVTDNENPAIGGTTSAFAPMMDCIKLTNTGTVSLSYHPVYDNLWYGELS